ncbi:MAG: 2-dehydropantoate 2-reductase [Rhizobiaceae bacterium]|nr:2-dehydropantoate 2-reductase [Rhizobiaceae bacterium]
MRILIAGAGGVGGYLGARLIEAGADVTFLVREARGKQLGEKGLVVRSEFGDFTNKVKTIGAADLGPDYDLVVVATKAYHLTDDLLKDLAKTKRDGCYVAPLLNGMQHMDRLDAVFGRETVFGGLCRISMVQEADGTLRHLGAGHTYVFGKRGKGGDNILDGLKAFAAKTKIDFSVSPDIDQTMWEKFYTLVTLAGATCLMRAPIGCIASAMEGRAFLADLFSEAAGVAHQAGHTSPPGVYSFFLKQLSDPASELTASILRDLEAGNAIEADHLIGDFYRRGRAFGLPMPLFRIIWIHMEATLARRERQAKKA